jgi:multicomponent Na+:H+ antiporter subunit D
MLIASFGLIVLAGNPLQLDAAVKYGVLNFLATTLFLAALGLLYGQLGTLNMADIVGVAARADIAPLTATAALFVLAFGMKAAVFPVNAWLPASYHAPPPAISALMGGLLTKVGLYALLRLMVMLLPGPREVLGSIIAGIGLATMILGPLGAIAEVNLRRAVGFLLIGGVGVVILAVPDGDPMVVSGGIAYVAHSMLTLSALYLAAGWIERVTGEGDTRHMGGLYARHPALGLIVMALFLGLAGIPPFLGFWPKFALLRGFIAGGDWIAVSGILLNAFLTLIAGTRLWSRIFWRKGETPGAAHPQGIGAVVLLGGTVLLLGVWPNLILGPSVTAAQDLLKPARYIAATGVSP